jgi:hypothetical protein
MNIARIGAKFSSPALLISIPVKVYVHPMMMAKPSCTPQAGELQLLMDG